MYIGPFSADEVDTIHRAMNEYLDKVEDSMGKVTELDIDSAVPFLEEQNRIGRIIDDIERAKLAL
jgi:hypothetical protein